MSVLDLSSRTGSELEPSDDSAATIADECVGDRSVSDEISYRQQFEELFSKPLKTSKPVPKPSNAANGREPAAVRVPFSNVYGTLMRGVKGRVWSETDTGRAVWFAVMHVVGLFALLPRFFSWPMLAAQFLLYCASGMGITYSYHRQLAHKSFKSPKWLEYLASVCGMCAFQGSPYEWVSDHRYHHLHTETPLDPHSSYEGFYWSHLGWMLDSEVYKQRCGDQSNAADLWAQPWYRWSHKNYMTIMLAHWTAMYALGGLAAVVWRAFFTALLYHVTWFVNSAAHLWGRQEYRTGDQSRAPPCAPCPNPSCHCHCPCVTRNALASTLACYVSSYAGNNWWVGWLAFGEGWHNNHHAFEYSARHGLRPRQFDVTYAIINLLRRVGLVHSVKLPTAAARRRLAIDPDALYIEPEVA